jgi:hypothetical protein
MAAAKEMEESALPTIPAGANVEHRGFCRMDSIEAKRIDRGTWS